MADQALKALRLVTLVARVRERGHPWLLARTVGIYACAPGGVPVAHGSGVLPCGSPTHPFVLVRRARSSPRSGRRRALSLAPPGSGSALISLAGVEARGHRRPCGSRLRLCAATCANIVNQLRTRRGVCRGSARSPSTIPLPSAMYCVIGFPRQATTFVHDENKIQARPLFYAGPLVEQNPDYLTRADLNRAFAVSPNDTTTGGGDLVRLPAFGGISGCGIWRLVVPGPDPMRAEEWSVDNLRLSGIEHAVVGRPICAIKGVLHPPRYPYDRTSAPGRTPRHRAVVAQHWLT